MSWDTVIYVKNYPLVGGFAQSNERIERLGGSAANLAQGLASADVDTGLVTFLGQDELGARIRTLLQESRIKELRILEVEDNSSHALVVIDESGERTVFALSNNYLSRLSLTDIGLLSNDIVVFPLWRPYFKTSIEYAKSIGCFTVVGLEALTDSNLPEANLAIGSSAELPAGTDVKAYLNRFDRIVVTDGAQGARLYSGSDKFHQVALPAEVVDTTGAGDSFLAGFLAALSKGDHEGRVGLLAGAMWSAVMVSQYRSIPPIGSEIASLMKILSELVKE